MGDLAAESRLEAIHLGLPYYHGKPCPKHNSTIRRVKRGECLRCRSEANIRSAQRARERDAEGWSAKKRASRAKIRDHANAKSARWKKENPEKYKASNRKYYETHKQQHLAYGREQRLKHPEKSAAIFARRRARKLRALPLWLTEDDRLEILSIYKSAKRLRLSVDHIIPLAGCSGCGAVGIEVPWNLRLMEKNANCAKGRRCDECWQGNEVTNS